MTLPAERSGRQPSAKADPDLLYLLQQYKNDLLFGVRDEGSRARRMGAINAAICKVEAAPSLYEACADAEAVMSIIEPQSDKEAYRNCLAQLRAVLLKAKGL